MKILYVCTTTDRGGAETALLRLATVAQQQGHTVQVISLKPLGTVAPVMQKAGLEVISLDLTGKLNPVQTAGVLARLIKQIQTFRPDIVHAFLYRAIQLCRLAKRRTSFCLITTPHYNVEKLSYGKKLIDRALRNEDDVSTAESQNTATVLIQKQRYPKEKVCLIPNGIDGKLFYRDAEKRKKYRKNNGFLENECVFCCVARLSKEKNHKSLLTSFAAVYAHYPTIRLVLVGDGPEKENILQEIRQNNLDRVVSLAGEVQDVHSFLCGADVFVLPSFIESLPLALLEASLCELPAIVNRVGDMPQVVQHGKTGFVCNAQDPIIISVLMTELIENKSLRTQMGIEARQFVLAQYPAAEQRFLEFYQRIK